MAIYIGNSNIKEIYYGSQKIKEVYYGNQLVWGASEFVDLGLPSGTLWMRCNIGAIKETDYGLYFQWGDTVGYSDASHSYWSKCPGNGGASDYDETALATWDAANLTNGLLNASVDAVYQATNGKAKMPTMAQFQELIDSTTNEWTAINGVNGYKFTNKSDSSKYIFVPAAGYADSGTIYGVGELGVYWSRLVDSSDTTYAQYFLFNSKNAHTSYSGVRCDAQSVRGVKNQDWHPTQLTAADFTFFGPAQLNISSTLDGIFYRRPGTHTWNAGTLTRAVVLLPKAKVKYSDVIGSNRIDNASNGENWSDIYRDMDKDMEQNYVRVLIPKGCKTISFSHTSSDIDLNFLAIDYTRKDGNDVVNSGWVSANTVSTLDVSNYNQGEDSNVKYMFYFYIRGTSDGDEMETRADTWKDCGLIVNFNY